eukprot:CAMPEP_0185836418 /NCGR_PEP_ID=MMETSP1353-20130828/9691_1 /TAXON_ID=1077150 /ORGANISM="Erythrolobus australicus, Strain CCMP3124" /LENGTH=48 /DNA_ID= /DNA_START= /DNA_END= /DNA_ORIENTATION=
MTHRTRAHEARNTPRNRPWASFCAAGAALSATTAAELRHSDSDFHAPP